jgi:Asp-tRNA(Asn)/Glu-tRNA(Gln) amidotransferase A subunit family amidase
MIIAASVLCHDWQRARDGDRLPVLGVPDGPYLGQTEPPALASFEEQLLMLQVAGYAVKRVQALSGIHELNQMHRRLIFAEFAQEHAEIYARHADLYRAKTAEAIRMGQTVSARECEDARAQCLELRRELEEAMDAEEVDLWICPPATGPAPAGIEATGDPNMNLPWTHAGMPAITVPVGQAENGLPLGLQLVARYGADEQLLAWSSSLPLGLSAVADD